MRKGLNLTSDVHQIKEEDEEPTPVKMEEANEGDDSAQHSPVKPEEPVEIDDSEGEELLSSMKPADRLDPPPTDDSVKPDESLDEDDNDQTMRLDQAAEPRPSTPMDQQEQRRHEDDDDDGMSLILSDLSEDEAVAASLA